MEATGQLLYSQENAKALIVGGLMSLRNNLSELKRKVSLNQAGNRRLMYHHMLKWVRVRLYPFHFKQNLKSVSHVHISLNLKYYGADQSTTAAMGYHSRHRLFM